MRKDIIIKYRGNEYGGRFEVDAHNRSRLFWYTDLSEKYRPYYSKDQFPLIRFFKANDNTFEVEFLNETLMEAREGGGPAEFFGWCQNLKDGSLERRLREAFTVAGFIFFLNCEMAKRYRIMLLSEICPDDIVPMGIESYRDVASLLAHANLDERRILVIPNAGSVVPLAQKGKE